MGFISDMAVNARNQRLLDGPASPEQAQQRRESEAKYFCDPFTLIEMTARVHLECERQFIERGRVAMVLVSAPEVTAELHGDEGCTRVLREHLQSHEPQVYSVDLLFHKGESGPALPRVLVTFQPALTTP